MYALKDLILGFGDSKGAGLMSGGAVARLGGRKTGLGVRIMTFGGRGIDSFDVIN